MNLPRTASFVAVSCLTVFVGLCSAFVVHLAATHFSTQRGWTVCALAVFSVWLFVAHCWQRLAAETAQAAEIAQEPPSEGVWPPPPRR